LRILSPHSTRLTYSTKTAASWTSRYLLAHARCCPSTTLETRSTRATPCSSVLCSSQSAKRLV
jgi:hypothetical protein